MPRRAPKIHPEDTPPSLLFRFIPGAERKALTALVEETKQTQADAIEGLYHSILAGEMRYDMRDENIDLYLFALFDRIGDEFSYEQWLTAYAIYLAHAQFTPGAAGIKDAAVKGNAPFTVHAIFEPESGKLTEWSLENYAKPILAQLSSRGLPLTPEALELILAKLPLSEQKVFILDDVYGLPPEVQSMLNGASSFSAWTAKENVGLSSTKKLIIPTFGLCLGIARHFRPELSLVGILGTISTETLREMHERHMHPAALHSDRCSKNYKKVHHMDCGAFSALFHDTLHECFMTTLMTGQRDFIFQELLPALDDIKDQSPDTVEELNQVQQALADMDLDGEFLQMTPENYFNSFIKRQGILISDPFFGTETNIEAMLHTYYLLIQKLLTRQETIQTTYKLDVTQLEYGQISGVSDICLTQSFTALIAAETQTITSETIVAKIAQLPHPMQEALSELLATSENAASLWNKISSNTKNLPTCFALWQVGIAFFPPSDQDRSATIFEQLKASGLLQAPSRLSAP